MSHKVVYNDLAFGLHLSEKAIKWLEARGCKDVENLPRHDKNLVECVETLGKEVNDLNFYKETELAIEEIEGDTYVIRYDDRWDCEYVDVPENYDWVKIPE